MRMPIYEVSSSVAGPVGILGAGIPAVQQQGITEIILLIAVISLNPRRHNVLPIPALDGGRCGQWLFFGSSKSL